MRRQYLLPTLLLRIQGDLRRAGVVAFAEAFAQDGKKKKKKPSVNDCPQTDLQARKEKGRSLVQ